MVRTEIQLFLENVPGELGKLTGIPEGVMKVDVNIKKINNRKIISVIDDILNVAWTF